MDVEDSSTVSSSCVSLDSRMEEFRPEVSTESNVNEEVERFYEDEDMCEESDRWYENGIDVEGSMESCENGGSEKLYENGGVEGSEGSHENGGIKGSHENRGIEGSEGSHENGGVEGSKGLQESGGVEGSEGSQEDGSVEGSQENRNVEGIGTGEWRGSGTLYKGEVYHGNMLVFNLDDEITVTQEHWTEPGIGTHQGVVEVIGQGDEQDQLARDEDDDLIDQVKSQDNQVLEDSPYQDRVDSSPLDREVMERQNTLVAEDEKTVLPHLNPFFPESSPPLNPFAPSPKLSVSPQEAGVAVSGFNPFLTDDPFHSSADMPSHEFYQQDLTMRRRTIEIGNREKRVTSDYYRAIFGLQGEINDWNWELAYNHIKSSSTERGVNGFPNSRRAQEAIDSGLWNPFEPSSNSQEALDFIETTTTRIGKSTSKSIDGTISGSLMEMKHGDLGLAVGFEYREESISDNPDDQFLRGDIFGTEATKANGSRDNTSIFAELAIPVLDTLEVQLAVRREDYSDFGTTTDPKVAFKWDPTDSLSFRGSYGTAFRAPSLHQIGLGNTDESPNLVDSVRCAAVGNVNKACEPQEYTAILSGNKELGPEESTSYNLGVIYQITDDLDVSVDYYDYDIENVITKDTQFKFSTLGADPSVVERLPSSTPGDPGEVVRIFDQFENIGNITTSGLDIEANYSLESDIGDIKFSYVVNYVLSYEDARPNADGTMRIDTKEGDFEQPEVRWTFNTAWSKADWNATVAVNYIGSFKQDAAVANDTMGDIDSWTTVDTTINYIGIENTTLSLGVTNLFNEEPPFTYHDFMGFVTSIHNGQGRFTYLKATYTF